MKQGAEQGGDWEAVDERKNGISEDEHKNRNVVYYKVCETEQNRKGPTVTFCITDMFPQKEVRFFLTALNYRNSQNFM